MKPSGLRVFLVGVVIWGGLAMLVAGALWWLLGIWPNTPKAWIFVLLMSPVVWVALESVSDVTIDLVDFLLPKIRYVRRAIERQFTDHEIETGMTAFLIVSRFLLHIARAVIIISVIYLVSQWLQDRIELPHRSQAVETLRIWWHANFS